MKLNEEIQEDKPHLTLASIYTALGYYYANKELLDNEFAAYDRECTRLEAEYKVVDTSKSKPYWNCFSITAMIFDRSKIKRIIKNCRN